MSLSYTWMTEEHLRIQQVNIILHIVLFNKVSSVKSLTWCRGRWQGRGTWHPDQSQFHPEALEETPLARTDGGPTTGCWGRTRRLPHWTSPTSTVEWMAEVKTTDNGSILSRNSFFSVICPYEKISSLQCTHTSIQFLINFYLYSFTFPFMLYKQFFCFLQFFLHAMQEYNSIISKGKSRRWQVPKKGTESL